MKSNWYNQAFYRVSVKALIRNNKKQLLVVSEKGSDFSLPGGGWDYGEDLHDCLVRELDEEIALKTDFSESVITAIPYFNDKKDALGLWIACAIEYEALEFNKGVDEDEVKWIDESDIDKTTLAGKLTQQVLEIDYVG